MEYISEEDISKEDISEEDISEMNISEEEYSEEYILKVKLLIDRRQGVEEIFYHGPFHKNIYIQDISAFFELHSTFFACRHPHC